MKGSRNANQSKCRAAGLGEDVDSRDRACGAGGLHRAGRINARAAAFPDDHRQPHANRHTNLRAKFAPCPNQRA